MTTLQALNTITSACRSHANGATIERREELELALNTLRITLLGVTSFESYCREQAKALLTPSADPDKTISSAEVIANHGAARRLHSENAEVSDGGPLTHESTETRTRRSLD